MTRDHSRFCLINLLALCALAGCTTPTAPPAPVSTIPATLTPASTLHTPTVTASAPLPTDTAPAPLSDEELWIKKYPGNFTSFRLETPTGVTIITDPYKMDEDVEADIVTVSHYHSDHADFSRITGEYRLIDAAGDYDEKGVRITGVAGHHDRGDTSTTNIIYVFDVDGIRLAQFASQGELPTDDMYAQIGKVDILIIQMYGWERGKLTAAEARSMIQRLQAKIVIPAHGDAGLTDALISLYGGASEKHPDGNLVVTERDLAEQQTPKVVLLDVPEE